MDASETAVKSEMRDVVLWAVFLPALAIWPFLSAMPLFTLLGGPPDALVTSINVILLCTGFWPVAALGLAYLALRSSANEMQFRPGLWLGGYATVWTGLYLVAAITNR